MPTSRAGRSAILTKECPVCNKAYTENDMVKCTRCPIWTHYSCAGVDDEVANDENWKCINCTNVHQNTSDQMTVGTNNFMNRTTSTIIATTTTAGIRDNNATDELESGLNGSEHSTTTRNSATSVRAQLKLYQVEQDILTRQQVIVQKQQELIEKLSNCSVKERSPNLEPNKKVNVHKIKQNKMVEQQQQTAKVNAEMPSKITRRRIMPFESLNENEISTRQLAARQALSKNLPTFTGDPSEWPIFINMYKQTTAACGFSDYENLIRLQNSIQGTARTMVEDQMRIPGSVEDIIDTLAMIFGRPELVLDQQIQRLRKMPAPKMDKLESFVSFAMGVKNICATLSQAGMEDYISNPMLMKEIQDKLPPTMLVSWAQHKRYSSDPNSLQTLSDWLYEIATDVCSVSTATSWVSKEASSSQPARKKNKGQQSFYQHLEVDTASFSRTKASEIKDSSRQIGVASTKSSHPTSGTSKSNNRCIVCKGSCRNVTNCQKFIEMDPTRRIEIANSIKLCTQCLKKHRNVCRFSALCHIENCKEKHHPLLHNNQQAVISNSKETEMSHQTPMSSTGISFRMIPVILSFNGKTIKTNAFLDEGSTSSLIGEEIASYLGLTGESEPLYLKWTGSVTRTEEQSKRVEVGISGVYRNAPQFNLSNVRTVSSLNLPTQSLNYRQLANQFPHIRHLPVVSYDNVSPGILIGLRNWSVAVPLNVKEGADHEPIAVYCRLGWTVFCSMGDKSSNNINETEVNDFHQEHPNAEDNLNEMVKEFLSVDSLGITAPKICKQQQEEQRAMDLLDSTTSYIGDRYQTGLLWRYENIKLPDSRPMAMRRLQGLEKRLKSDSVLAANVKQEFQKYLNKGYIRKLTAEDIRVPQNRKWYLPMFPVQNANKPGKIRLVWDAAAEVQGISLNTMLMKGMDLNSSLYGILLRCRQRSICIAADIREMFHQILMSEQDQQVLRFLWRDLDDNKEPDTYVLQVMAFGPTCSPSSAQYIKNKNAERFNDEFPRAVWCIIRNHYVDDLLDSVDTEEEALLLATQVNQIHEHAGFEIRNWRSNSKKVMEVLNPTSEDINVNMRLDQEHSTEKILGMWWCLTTDEFTYSLRFNKGNQSVLSGENKPTKREALRILMSIYDPLGLIAHFLVFLKILLQEIWRSHIDWDDEITDAQFETWLLWLKLLPGVEQVKIPRCYLKELDNWSDVNIQLHVFTDASEQACATVAYLRIESGNQVICSIVAAKTKVAPIKLRSVPRLELDAAVMGCRLAKHIQEQLTVHIHNMFYWTDSRTILGWIRGEPRDHDKFIAFRVAEIQDDSNVRNWRYVPSKVNVADDATKWTRTPSFNSSDRWFQGPDFLYHPDTLWPKNIVENSIELLGVHTTHEPFVIFKRFSKWQKLLNCMAYVLRFVNNTKKDLMKQKDILTQEELKSAEIEIIKMAQADVYLKEINDLKKILSNGLQQTVDKSSQIYKFSPYLDEDGVLRVHGRIDAAIYLQYDTRRPIILPRGHKVTELIILYEHEIFLHQNHESVINKLRQRYRIPQLRSEFKSVILGCQFCKIRKAKPVPPQMASLPSARLSAYVAPFTYVGVDYFGPMAVKCGRRSEKRWGVLFACMTTRAVHIEIAAKMDSDTFILCFTDFISRRGSPAEIYCDRGTNFIGAERMLRQELEAVDPKILAKNFVSPRLKWNFNPPASPHMGGSWERLVKCFKSALYASLPESNPSDQLLRSCLVSAENIINSRPLTYIPLDNEEEEVLTPNHFLGLVSGDIKPIGNPEHNVKVLRLNYKCKERFSNNYWKMFIEKYLPELTLRSKWFEPVIPLQEGDIVLIIDKELPRNNYPKGRVLEVRRAVDGQVRSAVVKTSNGTVERPAVKLARLEVKKE